MKYIMEFISMKKCFVAPLCCLSQFLETGADSHLLWNKCTLVPQYVFPNKQMYKCNMQYANAICFSKQTNVH